MTDSVHQPRIDTERLLRALARCDADCPLTTDAARSILRCSSSAAMKALSRLVKAGKAVRYHPGEFGPVQKQALP